MKINFIYLMMLFIVVSMLLFTTCEDNKKNDILLVSPAVLYFDADEVDEQKVKITTNVKEWRASRSSDQRWITVIMEDSEFWVKVETYSDTNEERTGTITVTAGNAKAQTIEVIQFVSVDKTIENINSIE